MKVEVEQGGILSQKNYNKKYNNVKPYSIHELKKNIFAYFVYQSFMKKSIMIVGTTDGCRSTLANWDSQICMKVRGCWNLIIFLLLFYFFGKKKIKEGNCEL